VPCAVCGELGDDDKTLLCEECDRPYHTFCLDPPLDGISGDDWFCLGCAPSTARYRPEKRQQGPPPKQTQTGVHSGGGMLARGSATSAAVGSGFDGASSYPEFESAKEVAKKRERADGGKAEASAKSDGRASCAGTPRQASGVRAGASVARSQDATRAHWARQTAAKRMAGASVARSQGATRAHGVRQAAARRMAAASVAKSQDATRAQKARQTAAGRMAAASNVRIQGATRAQRVRQAAALRMAATTDPSGRLLKYGYEKSKFCALARPRKGPNSLSLYRALLPMSIEARVFRD